MMERPDIWLTRDGDIVLTDTGDIKITNSIQQAILIHLRWIFSEWRLGPDFGFPYWEDVFIKNPDIERIKRDIRTEILKVEGVRAAKVESVTFDPAGRSATFIYSATTDEDTFREEVTLYA